MSFLEYAPAPESRAILNLRDEYGLFIDGDFRPGTGESFATISPVRSRQSRTASSMMRVTGRVAAGETLPVDVLMKSPPARIPSHEARRTLS